MHKLHYTLLKRYELRLSLSGMSHSDGRCCSMVYYKNHWGQLKRGHASLGSNIFWCFPLPRTAAYKGHFLHRGVQLLRGRKGWWQHGAMLGCWSGATTSASSGGLTFAVRSWEVLEGTSSLKPFHVKTGASVPAQKIGKGLSIPWITLIWTYTKKSINFDRILGWSRVQRWIFTLPQCSSLGILVLDFGWCGLWRDICYIVDLAFSPML